MKQGPRGAVKYRVVKADAPYGPWFVASDNGDGDGIYCWVAKGNLSSCAEARRWIAQQRTPITRKVKVEGGKCGNRRTD